MAPIRVGLIGLSTIVPNPAAYTPGTWGLVHLSSLQTSPHYEIVALCNSSLDAARKSIEHHKLDASKVKAYGSPEDLAADPDVDLVAVSVSVFKHYQLMKPALLAGKNVMVEYPVAPKLEETEELAKLAREKGVKTVVGAQALGDVVLRKMKELVDTKVIGDIVSSNWIGHAPVSTAQGWPANLTVFIDNDSAQSRISIVFGHAVSMITAVLGDFTQVQSVYKTQDKTAPLFDDKGTVTNPSYNVTAPDNVLVQGVLQDGGIASLGVRFSTAPVSDVGYRWIISGTKGEIELIDSKPGWFHQGLPVEDTKIYLRKQGAEKTEEVKVTLDKEPEHLKGLLPHVVNTARLYESFATGDTSGYLDVDATLKVQKLMEKINKNAVWAP